MTELQVERNVLEANEKQAELNRAEFEAQGLFVINLMSSPGAGKTTLLERTVEALKGELRIAVIEGDIQSTHDADKIAAHGVPAVQINTRGGCHLEAGMVLRAARALDLGGVDILIIENVGNLVCPAEFALGEEARVTLLSTPEGDDKPLKYPLMFSLSQVLIVNKIDLLEYLPFDPEKAEAEVRKLQPEIEIIRLSALKSEGLEPWLDWLRDGAARAKGSAEG